MCAEKRISLSSKVDMDKELIKTGESEGLSWDNV